MRGVYHDLAMTGIHGPLFSHMICVVTRSDDTWMRDNGRFLNTSRGRERGPLYLTE